jgi:catechol-2,3-dioxygenase
MQLNHVDLQVSDVNNACEFFERFFALRCTYQRAGQIALLEDETSSSLGVSNIHNSPAPAYPPDFHVGFVLERTTDVREIYDRLKEAGVPMRFDLQGESVGDAMTPEIREQENRTRAGGDRGVT